MTRSVQRNLRKKGIEMQLTKIFYNKIIKFWQFSMVAHIPSCLNYPSPSFILCALRTQELNKIFIDKFIKKRILQKLNKMSSCELIVDYLSNCKSYK